MCFSRNVFSAQCLWVCVCVSLCAVRLFLRACATLVATVKSVSGAEETPVFCDAVRSVFCVLLPLLVLLLHWEHSVLHPGTHMLSIIYPPSPQPPNYVLLSNLNTDPAHQWLYTYTYILSKVHTWSPGLTFWWVFQLKPPSALLLRISSLGQKCYGLWSRRWSRPAVSFWRGTSFFFNNPLPLPLPLLSAPSRLQNPTFCLNSSGCPITGCPGLVS